MSTASRITPLVISKRQGEGVFSAGHGASAWGQFLLLDNWTLDTFRLRRSRRLAQAAGQYETRIAFKI